MGPRAQHQTVPLRLEMSTVAPALPQPEEGRPLHSLPEQSKVGKAAAMLRSLCFPAAFHRLWGLLPSALLQCEAGS
jgi:hypothetical protein